MPELPRAINEGQLTALNVTITGFLHDLRYCKQAEFNWITLYGAATLPALGYMYARGSNPLLDSTAEKFAACALYLGLSCLTMKALVTQRNSYYRVLRAIKRSQTLLGLDELHVLSPRMRNSTALAGVGDYAGKDGTQRRAGFLQRLLLVWGLYIAMVGSIFRDVLSNWIGALSSPLSGLFAPSTNALWLIFFAAASTILFAYFYLRDRPEMVKESKEELAELPLPRPLPVSKEPVTAATEVPLQAPNAP